MGQNYTQLHASKRTRLIAALVEADNRTQAAKLAGVSRKGLYLWLAQEDFKRDLAEAEREYKSSHMSTTVKRMSRAGPDAVDVLVRIAHDEAQPAAARVAAAKALISLSIEVITLGEIDARLRELEKTKTIDAQPVWSGSDDKIQSIA